MKNIKLIIIVVGIIAVTAFFGTRFLGDKDSNTTYKDEPVQATATTPLDSQTSSEGQVSVTATSIDQSDWSFQIILDTHSVELTEDLTQVSALLDENGNEYKPIEWQGDPPGGHHRSGVLRFGEIMPESQSVTLVVRQVGGIDERRFEWTTKP